MRQLPGVFGDLVAERDIDLPHDIRVKCGIVDVIERHLMTTRTWEPGVLHCIRTALRPGDTFLDIGANLGFFTLNASRIAGPSGRVVSIEPSQRTAVKLLTNVLRNRAGNVLVLTIGASDSPGLVNLNLVRSDNPGASTIRPITGHIGQETIAVARMDDVLESLSIVPTVIKIDIEGAEFLCLKGLRRTLASAHPLMIIELKELFLRQAGTSIHEVLQFLAELGYSASAIDYETGATRPASVDDLIALSGDVLFSARPAREDRP